MSTLLPILVFHILALVSPGPDFFLVSRNSVKYSASVGLYTVLGITLGVTMHISLSLLGVGLIISQSVLLFNLLKYVGAAYLICLGIASFLSNPEKVSEDFSSEKKSEMISKREAFKMGLLCNALNPKATLAFLSVFTVMLSPETPILHQLFVAVFMIVTACMWHSTVAIFFSRSLVRSVFLRMKSSLDRAMGVLFVAIGLRVANAD